MVSSFQIKTDINVPIEIAEEFNALVLESPVFGEELTTPDYFDMYSDNFALPRKNPRVVTETAFYDSWEFGDDGTLIDASEKFHGAIRVLHYRINTFFAPRGIKLNGTIIGVNTEHPMCYIYTVVDNKISLDVDATLMWLEGLRRTHSPVDYYDYDTEEFREYSENIFNTYFPM
jgi:hypothetical protein